jgi:hypothetical protein
LGGEKAKDEQRKEEIIQRLRQQNQRNFHHPLLVQWQAGVGCLQLHENEQNKNKLKISN